METPTASTELFVLLMDGVMKHAVHTETHLKPPPHPLPHISDSRSSLCINPALYTHRVAPDPILHVNSLFLYGEQNSISRAPEQRPGLGMCCFRCCYQHHDSPCQRPDNIRPSAEDPYSISELLCLLAIEFKHILTSNSHRSECNSPTFPS